MTDSDRREVEMAEERHDLQNLLRVVREWQLARDRYDQPYETAEQHQEREQWLLLWERKLRDTAV